MQAYVEALSQHLVLGELLGALTALHGDWTLLAHWKQGEFHHDLVVALPADGSASGCKEIPPVLVIATNCNGGVKEVLAFDTLPDRDALWHARCPEVPEFGGVLVPLLARVRTEHWFDPCMLLRADARSELKPSCRKRQRGGGWEPVA